MQEITLYKSLNGELYKSKKKCIKADRKFLVSENFVTKLNDTLNTMADEFMWLTEHRISDFIDQQNSRYGLKNKREDIRIIYNTPSSSSGVGLSFFDI